MKHTQIIPLLQYPLVASLAVIGALAVVYPTYWNKLTAKTTEQVYVPAWTEEERMQAREIAMANASVPAVDLERVDVGQQLNVDEMIQSLSQEPVDTQTADNAMESLPDGGVITDTLSHTFDRWSMLIIERKAATCPEGLELQRPVAWIAARLASYATLVTDNSTTTSESIPDESDSETTTVSVTTQNESVQIVNANLSSPVSFVMDGKVVTLKPGDSIAATAGSVVKFDRGGGFGVAAETLTSGEHRFDMTPEHGWKISTVPATK